jgi:hypothetical protein
MNTDSSKMSQQIEQYLQGRLSPSEEQAFEEAYLGDPDLLDQIMLTEKLQQGFKDSAPAPMAVAHSAKAWRFWNTPQYAAAASVLFAASMLMSGLLYQDNRSLRDAGSSVVAASPATRLVPLIAVRGQADFELAAPAAGEWTVLLADPGFGDYDRFEASVSRQTPAGIEPVWQSAGLKPGYEGLLAIGLPGRLLTAGDYELVIRGRMPDWPDTRSAENAGQFTFSVSPTP